MREVVLEDTGNKILHGDGTGVLHRHEGLLVHVVHPMYRLDEGLMVKHGCERDGWMVDHHTGVVYFVHGNLLLICHGYTRMVDLVDYVLLL